MSSLYKFTEEAASDYAFLVRNYPKLAKKVSELIKDTLNTPTQGLGKPEQLKYKYSGCWSRRISMEHRLVYKIDGDVIIILSCMNHYK